MSKANESSLFDPDEASEGGGGVVQAASDVTLTFECTTYDYGGSVAVPVPAIHMHGEYEGDEGAIEFDEYYSMGDASKFRPKEDGTGFDVLTEGARPVKTCKGMQLISSIISANGGDKSIVTGNIKDLDGLNANVARKPDIDRPGIQAKAGARQRTILLVTEINSLPGEKKAKGGKTTGKGKPVGKGKSNIKAKTIAAINAVLEAAGEDGVSAEDLPQVLFRANKKDPDVKAMMELAGDEDFLADESTPWANDGETLTYQE